MDCFGHCGRISLGVDFASARADGDFRPMTLGTPISRLFMVGPAYTNKLGRLNINTVGDLLYHFPFRYLDYSLVSPLGQVQAGETVSVKGQVLSFTNQYTRRRQTIQKAVISDGTGQLQATWFNQPFLMKILKYLIRL